MSDTDRLPDPGLTGSFQVPQSSSLVFEEPLSAEIHAFLNLAAKATKGLRVYASNNETLRRYLDEAFRALNIILERDQEMTLNVREDRFLHGKDVVHVNPDREESIPYIFYRNAFRRITLVRGFTLQELVNLLSAVIADYSGADYAGEDLVTALWRLALPHLRYLTIDAMTVDAKSAKSDAERDDIERIQADIEGIVAMIYKTSSADDDIVAGISITKEDLEALKEIRAEGDEDLDLLDVATARAIADIDHGDIDSLMSSLYVETRDSLTTKMLDILIVIAFKEQSSAESAMTIELIQQLFDSLLVAQRYGHACHLVKRLRDHRDSTEDLKEKHIANHLLRIFSSEARVLPVLNTFNDDYKSKSLSEVTEFLRALGPSIVPHMLSALDSLSSPAHRRLVSDLILEHGIPDRRILADRMLNAKWFLARDILHIASRLPLHELSPLIEMGLKSEHPKVREYAVGMLRPYARGNADRLIAERLLDDDLEVRLAAIRVAAARRTPDTRAAFEVLLTREDLQDREARELRLLMAAYAAICGSDAVPLLDRVLAPSLFGKARMADAQIAAAFALGSIGSLAATSSLQRGVRTLNTRVREACKKALAQSVEKSPSGEIPVPNIPPAKSDPLQIPPTPSSSWTAMSPPGAEPTPVFNRSAKAMGIAIDAPNFGDAPLPVDEKKREHAQYPQFISGPALGRVHAVQAGREEMPLKMLVGSPVEHNSSQVFDPSEDLTIESIEAADRELELMDDEPVHIEAVEDEPIALDPSDLVITDNIEIMPDLPQMQLPELVREKVTIKDQVKVPAKRIPGLTDDLFLDDDDV
jgi:hypothetical protein